MPKFLVSIASGTAAPEVLEVTADNPEEACWIVLSSRGDWKAIAADDIRVSDAEEHRTEATLRHVA